MPFVNDFPHLRRGQSCGLGQVALLARRWIRIVRVPVSQYRAGFLLNKVNETITIRYYSYLVFTVERHEVKLSELIK